MFWNCNLAIKNTGLKIPSQRKFYAGEISLCFFFPFVDNDKSNWNVTINLVTINLIRHIAFRNVFMFFFKKNYLDFLYIY